MASKSPVRLTSALVSMGAVFNLRESAAQLAALSLADRTELAVRVAAATGREVHFTGRNGKAMRAFPPAKLEDFARVLSA